MFKEMGSPTDYVFSEDRSYLSYVTAHYLMSSLVSHDALRITVSVH